MSGDTTGSGSAPGYTDLSRGCVQQTRSGLVLEATTAGPVPQRMPDRDTHLSIGFELDPGPRSTYVVAEATSQGWRAYLTRGSGRQALPAPVVTGDGVRVELPAPGRTPARWRVESSWTRSTLVSTAYAFDETPNGHAAALQRR